MKLRMLSIKELWAGARRTVTRFPLLTFFLCVGAANHLYDDIFKQGPFDPFSRNVFMCVVLLVPVLYALRLFRESGWFGEGAAKVLEVVAIAGCALYFRYLPDQALISLHYSQFAVLLAACVLLPLVAIKPGSTDDDYYWQFHLSVAVRLIMTVIYALIIIGGTSAALGAIDALFKTKLFHNESRIVIITLWIFAPIFFLSDVPSFGDAGEKISFRPKWLKNIGIYVMIPLAVVYLGILYAYAAKVLVEWQLPEGSVSYLILSFAAFGILTTLVVFPFQRDESSKWYRLFSRYFYFLQIPLLFLLFDAIFTRVFAYGVTFPRYYVLALAVWLLFLTAFMIVRKNRNLIVMPLSLLVIAVLSLVGPWSSFNVSYVSQKGRLTELLKSNGMIQGGRVAAKGEGLPLRTRAEISSIAKYLADYGKLQSMAYLTSRKWVTPQSFTKEMGFEYVERYHNEGTWYSCSCGTCKTPLAIPVENDQLFVRFPGYTDTDKKSVKKVQVGGISVEFLPESAAFLFTDSNSHSARIRLQDLAKHCRDEVGGADNCGCNYLYEDSRLRIQCLFGSLSGSEDRTGTHFHVSDVDFFIKKK